MRILKDNRGTAVVEMSFIIPIILTIIVMIIYLFFNTLNDGYIQGNCSYKIYTYSPYNVESNVSESRGFVHSKSSDEHLFVGIRNENGEWTNPLTSTTPWLYEYTDKNVDYCTEYDLCTDRLRRWQCYGDVLQ